MRMLAKGYILQAQINLENCNNFVSQAFYAFAQEWSQSFEIRNGICSFFFLEWIFLSARIY